MDVDYPKRKHVRLKDYDYSQAGMYFVTICTKDRQRILSRIVTPVGPDAPIGPQIQLTEMGHVVEKYILSMNTAYQRVKVEHYVIMPNHIHLLIHLTGSGPMGASGPTVPQVVKGLKGLTTRELGRTIWQSGYHEHIIRDDNDFLNHWTYIETNPARWTQDEYYQEERERQP